ncbi:MAG: hypothetical protein KGO96_01705 [Elusimicrobia bacterium]|nr:hypothetical protein [Elusimicrobiota bacterium]MDE2424610.1 hypothetical protein [Elusimicrobiota bacterium]
MLLVLLIALASADATPPAAPPRQQFSAELIQGAINNLNPSNGAQAVAPKDLPVDNLVDNLQKMKFWTKQLDSARRQGTAIAKIQEKLIDRAVCINAQFGVDSACKDKTKPTSGERSAWLVNQGLFFEYVLHLSEPAYLKGQKQYIDKYFPGQFMDDNSRCGSRPDGYTIPQQVAVLEQRDGKLLSAATQSNAKATIRKALQGLQVVGGFCDSIKTLSNQNQAMYAAIDAVDKTLRNFYAIYKNGKPDDKAIPRNFTEAGISRHVREEIHRWALTGKNQSKLKRLLSQNAGSLGTAKARLAAVLGTPPPAAAAAPAVAKPAAKKKAKKPQVAAAKIHKHAPRRHHYNEYRQHQYTARHRRRNAPAGRRRLRGAQPRSPVIPRVIRLEGTKTFKRGSSIIEQGNGTETTYSGHGGNVTYVQIGQSRTHGKVIAYWVKRKGHRTIKWECRGGYKAYISNGTGGWRMTNRPCKS